jgi:hypothetical protein
MARTAPGAEVTLLLLVAVVATFASGFYAGAWYMARVAQRSIDAAFDDLEPK